jgi:hypothetical protein
MLQSSAYRRHAEARNCAPQVAAYQSQRKAKRNALRKRETSESHAGILSAVTSVISGAVSRLPSKTGSASPPHITNIQNVRTSCDRHLVINLSSDVRRTVYLRNCSRGDRRPILHQQRVHPARSDRGTEVRMHLQHFFNLFSYTIKLKWHQTRPRHWCSRYDYLRAAR